VAKKQHHSFLQFNQKRHLCVKLHRWRFSKEMEEAMVLFLGPEPQQMNLYIMSLFIAIFLFEIIDPN